MVKTVLFSGLIVFLIALPFFIKRINAYVFYDNVLTGAVRIANDIEIRGGTSSLSVWVAADQDPRINARWLFGYVSDTGIDVEYWLAYADASGVNRIEANRAQEGTANCIASSTITLASSTWYNVVSTYDTTNLKLYIDGTLKDTKACSGNGAGGALDETLIGCASTVQGCNASTSIRNFRVRNFQVWKKVLSAAEIEKLKNGVIPADNDTGLQLYWPLDEGSGTVANTHANTTTWNGTVSSSLLWNSSTTPPYTFKLR